MGHCCSRSWARSCAGVGAALADAAVRQAFEPGYTAELTSGPAVTRAPATGCPGAASHPIPTGLVQPSPLRRFPRGDFRQPHQLAGHGRRNASAEFLVIVTPGDDVVDCIRAGKATSAVLLAATRMGLAITPLSQGINRCARASKIDASRRAIRRDVLHVPEHPQLVMRVGWPATNAGELPVTPRRDLRAVLRDGS